MNYRKTQIIASQMSKASDIFRKIVVAQGTEKTERLNRSGEKERKSLIVQSMEIARMWIF